MKTELTPAAVVAAIAIVGALIFSPTKQPEPAPAPNKPEPNKPTPWVPPWPTPPPKPNKPCPNCPGAAVGGVTSPDGKEKLQCDLPGDHHQRNSVGIDGLGLCVFASMRHSGDWQGDRVFYDLFEWMKRRPGGSDPPKTDQMIKLYCAEKGIPRPSYIHIRTADLDVLRAATRNNLMPAVGYWRSPTGRYGGSRIAHMVSLVHASQSWFAVLDNNYPGETEYEWMSPNEFQKCWADGDVWAMVLLTTPPPAPPKNGGAKS